MRHGKELACSFGTWRHKTPDDSAAEREGLRQRGTPGTLVSKSFVTEGCSYAFAFFLKVSSHGIVTDVALSIDRVLDQTLSDNCAAHPLTVPARFSG